MKSRYIEEQITFDGSQLHSLWALKSFNICGDSIVAFRGQCNITLDNLLDMGESKKKTEIYSEEMLHFVVEHFDMDLEKAITRQRLFIAIVKEEVERQVQLQLSRYGNTLYYGNKKLSVSISTLTPVSTMIHVGLNISSQNTPVETVGLADFNIGHLSLASTILKRYVEEIEGIRMARCRIQQVL